MPVASPIFLAVWLLAALAVRPAFAQGLIREEGAVYLEEFVTKPVFVTTADAARVFLRSDLQKYVGTLRVGQRLQLLAITDSVARVRGNAEQGQVAGWLPLSAIRGASQEFLTALRANARRKQEVDEFVKRNEVAINMTVDEVISSLGKPTKRHQKLDAAGRTETWEYTRYERVPQQVTGRDREGRLVTSTVYVKVPAGTLTVSFKNQLVDSLEQTEGGAAAPPVRLVTAPIVVAY
jgi:hypothetical protein